MLRLVTRETAAARASAAQLHALADAGVADLKRVVPDGVIPAHLAPLLSSLGVPDAEVSLVHEAVIIAQLRAVGALARQRTAQVVHHWKLVGVDMDGLGDGRYPALVACQRCSAPRRYLYHVDPADGAAERALVDHIVSDKLDAVAGR
eukprot:4354030-Prymnesium_polylepis.1